MLRIMSDSNLIGSRTPLGTVPQRPAATPARAGGGAGTAAGVAGGRTQRMLPAGVDVEALDRTAPRGTHLDIMA